MANWKKLAQGAAGAAGGAGLNVEEVFSTYLYDGAGSAQTITNGIDLSTEGGLVWVKVRDTAVNHNLSDTERGASFTLHSNSTQEDTEYPNSPAYGNITSFNTDGFTLGADTSGAAYRNDSSHEYVSWTFRKAPKFFDVVTYNGNSGTNVISHNLGSTPGCMFIKCTSSSAPSGTTSQWMVYHRGLSSPTAQALYLNSTTTAQGYGTGLFGVSDTTFTLNNTNETNDTGNSYVAYLFAHNDGDGGFGPNGDQDIIKCGSYTGNGSSTGPEIDLGFEPQWLIVKEASNANSWFIIDAMRGIISNGDDNTLRANTNGAEGQSIGNGVRLTATGFKVENSSTGTNRNNSTYIYIAIRRGPMAVPESATDVFAMDFLGATSPNPPAYNSSGWPVDMGIQASVGAVNSNVNSARLIQGTFLRTDSTQAETGNTQYAFDFQDGWRDSTAVSNNYLGYMWRRAPNFFDVVAYTGTGSARTIDHNLGVKPDMMWFKKRNSTSNWAVWHKDLTSTTNGYILLDQPLAEGTLSTAWNGTEPTASNFSLGTWSQVNQSSSTFICYLFASLNGVSKVGTYSGNGGTSVTGTGQNIDCGFSSGARFVIIKALNADDHWFVYDTTRGIVAGNDATLFLNLTSAQSTTSDEIDPLNSGFTILNGNNQLNRTGRDYIFYAIA
jgi:hypothetical protein